MPAAHSIRIDRTGNSAPGARFDPTPLAVFPGDVISWANNDPSQAHWPARIRPDGTVDETSFMSQAIPPDNSSTDFSPANEGEIKYCCALHPDEQGTINVTKTVAAVFAAGSTGGSEPSQPEGPTLVKTPAGMMTILVLVTAAIAALLFYRSSPPPVYEPTSTVAGQAPPQSVECAPFGQQPLIKMPEIPRDPGTGVLRAVLYARDELRNLWFSRDQAVVCVPQFLRYFSGYRPGHPEDWNVDAFKVGGFPEPIPGPTLRARVGDLIQITFLNQIQAKDFGKSIDLGEKNLGCNESRSEKGVFYPGSDTMPNCIHGSSTSNLHFHGTHTTPSTTGDNVLIQVRPSLRTYPPEPDGNLVVTENVVAGPFAEFFKWCETNGSPSTWDQLPLQFRQMQMGQSTTSPGGWIGTYDKMTDYSRAPLWGPNQDLISHGEWPTYFIGAFPYCFRVPRFDPAQVKMGQSPGTHWYHAHKHGSTDINVSNGMTGALIIEGDYDDTLRDFYKVTPDHQNWGLEDQVLMIQQLAPLPNIVSSVTSGPAPSSVNGRRQPLVTMRPGQVQLWRFINGSNRDLVSLCPSNGLTWRQTAQDGVQLSPHNYGVIGAPNRRIDMAAANRADLLVQAPTAAGDYPLIATAGAVAPPSGSCAGQTLLTIRVDTTLPAANPPMPFIDEARFPVFPAYLSDIPASAIRHRRELVFATERNGPPPAPRTAPPANSHFIDGEQFADHRIDQSMLLDSVEEWKLLNLTTGGINHPFHIHVNPFQVTELFDPRMPDMAPGGACGVDLVKPDTWKPCAPATGDFVWWDVFAIPAGVNAKLPASVCTSKAACPEAIRDKVTCVEGKSCTVLIPGYIKMRTRFADYPGQFVLHCHILIHEDRGMMQLVQVVPNTTLRGHQ